MPGETAAEWRGFWTIWALHAPQFCHLARMSAMRCVWRSPGRNWYREFSPARAHCQSRQQRNMSGWANGTSSFWPMRAMRRLILPFLVRSGFSLARRIGKEQFLNSVNAGSPADIRTYAEPEVREAMLLGSQICLSEYAHCMGSVLTRVHRFRNATGLKRFAIALCQCECCKAAKIRNRRARPSRNWHPIIRTLT